MTTTGGPSGQRALQMLMEVAAGSKQEMITLGELLDALHGRAFGVVLFTVGIIDAVPLPPGVSSVVGIPVLILGMQMVLGRRRPWLPQVIRRRAIRREKLLGALRSAEPYVSALDRICRARWPGSVHLLVPRAIGAVIVVLAAFIMLPMFFTNTPPALATVFLAIALTEEDGLMLVVGLGVAAIAVVISGALAAGTILVAVMALTRFLGF